MGKPSWAQARKFQAGLFGPGFPWPGIARDMASKYWGNAVSPLSRALGHSSYFERWRVGEIEVGGEKACTS